MAVVGVICEYDPFHRGHAWHLAAARRLAGEDSRILCVMSGDVTQRGDFSQWDKFARAELALAAGADLVLELPPERAAAPARNFAMGAVELLRSAGVVTHLAFGSESGDPDALTRLARAEEDPAFDTLLRERMRRGSSYAAARQQALESLAGPAGQLVRQPNDTLAVEYLRACRVLGADLTPLAVPRRGAGHGEDARAGFASGSFLRELLGRGDWHQAEPYLTERGSALLRREAARGRGPAGISACPGALFALRRAAREDFLRLPDCGPELAARLWEAARRAGSVEEFLALGRSRRVPLARVRRAALHLVLGLTREEAAEPPAYLRVLGFGPGGQALLREMRERAALPVLSRPGAVNTLGPAARAAFERVVRVRDLRSLAIPGGGEAPGTEWTQSPVRWEEKT